MPPVILILSLSKDEDAVQPSCPYFFSGSLASRGSVGPPALTQAP